MTTKENNNSNDNIFPCPICFREFHKNNIENHVNKCIFLNSDTQGSNNKRSSSPNKLDTPELKKTKIEIECSSSDVDVNKDCNQVNVNYEVTNIKKEKPSSISDENIPLAEFMRPEKLDDIVGHKECFGAGSLLRSILLSNKIPNMILWGPPGCGKTSIANVIANICKEQSSLRFVKLSATTSGIQDVKDLVKVAKNEALFKRHTVLFMDEIHRFNKLQQDTFLPHVENGTITLIGATTENPSFSLNNALLSRCRVIVMEKLSVQNITSILERAVLKKQIGAIVDEKTNKTQRYSEGNTPQFIIEKASLQWLAEMSDGDARIALGALELALASRGTNTEDNTPFRITLENIKEGIKRTHILYDRKGEEHYNIISAIHKSVRASDDNAALYWTVRALHAGEDPLYIARRMIRIACEDIGLGDPNALVEAVACMEGCKHVGMPECDVLLSQCAVRLARAPKSTEVYRAMKRAQQSLKDAKGPLPSVPMALRNAPTKLMKELGYGKGYNTSHRDSSGLVYMPEGFENVNFFDPDS